MRGSVEQYITVIQNIDLDEVKENEISLPLC